MLLAVKSPSYFKQTVDEILLRHRGDMVKFALSNVKPDTAKALLPSHADIDRWMDSVTGHNVKELTLAMPCDIRYDKCVQLSNHKMKFRYESELVNSATIAKQPMRSSKCVTMRRQW
ncbi:hypothetical protein BC332_11917 [Capsicum chinense]|nr:hypothetical protein BC332_11917 [Capsicum chinense]